ncbi:MAG: hypothetical protein A2Y62_00620 [Candidatus Fischerbacteria bacterium RBG_13_37_8]|uniref:Peptidase S45 n=1 Tax=Candidatus Fischerbacteria bacterium RBG_13_37_8 TaxID=1817863 RepID=A0A1F5VNH4_9BACT|nr:MAG: hypothetical protein A2Y62_00620 [Candidatus Fischerbacteria bacterium RBG_13_37_8]
MRLRWCAAIVFLVIIVLVFYSATIIKTWFSIRKSIPVYTGEFSAPSIGNEIHIFWDEAGIPHIFTENEEDYFFALGYIHAMERLFQMESYRRLAGGKLSEIYGEEGVSVDTFFRCLNLTETVRLEEFILEPELKNKLRFYTNGINYFIKKNQERLSPEFIFLNIEPELWEVSDVLKIMKVISWNFSFNYQAKKIFWKLRQKVSIDKVLTGAYPLEYPAIVNDSASEEEAIDKYLGGLTGTAASNSWVVDPNLSVSNHVLLANDMHSISSIPTLWYQAHGNIKGRNILGAGIPGIPFYLVGRNDAISWGITILPADTQDIDLHKETALSNIQFDRKIEKIEAKGGEIILINVHTGEHSRGMIPACDDYFNKQAYEIFWTGFIPGENLKAFYLMNNATTWNDFLQALSLASAPPFNFIYGDNRGNIGYYPAGLIPKRINQISLFPYTTHQEWNDFLSHDEKPRLYNPQSHYIITANNKITDDQRSELFAIDWLGSFRAERIQELLTTKKQFKIEDFQAFQLDTKSTIAEIVVPYIKKLPDNMLTAEALKVKQHILQWNVHVNDSIGALFFEVYYSSFMRATFEDELGKDLYDRYAEFVSQGRYTGIVAIIEDKENRWFDNIQTSSKENRDIILANALDSSYQWLVEHLGKDRSQWKWSALHKVEYVHPLADTWLTRRLFNIPPVGIDGSIDTVNTGLFKLDDTYDVHLISTLRFIVDLNGLNETYSIINIGQSGHPMSRHYKDQMDLWRQGKLYKWVISKEALEKITRQKMKFIPVSKHQKVN